MGLVPAPLVSIDDLLKHRSMRVQYYILIHGGELSKIAADKYIVLAERPDNADVNGFQNGKS